MRGQAETKDTGPQEIGGQGRHVRCLKWIGGKQGKKLTEDWSKTGKKFTEDWWRTELKPEEHRIKGQETQPKCKRTKVDI